MFQIKNLNLWLKNTEPQIQILRDFSFNVEEGQTVALVGESGSGKSISMLAATQLLDKKVFSTSGETLYKNQNLNSLPLSALQRIRNSEVAMIFQDPIGHLNPCFNIESHFTEILVLTTAKHQIRSKIIELLIQVGITDPESRLKMYPHQLSGGICQRVMIAMAIAGKPKLLIADEPTTALDVTIQKQIIELLMKLQKDLMMSLVFISHDLSLIHSFVDYVYVLYAGEVVEHGLVSKLFTQPQHPYTELLLKSLPATHLLQMGDPDFRLPTIPGQVVSLLQRPKGCQLFDRCYKAQAQCKQEFSELQRRTVLCHFPRRVGDSKLNEAPRD